MTLNIFTSGVNTSFSSELNENFIINSLLAVDTGTGLNVATSTASSSTVATSTYSISGNDLEKSDYLEISFNGLFTLIGRGGTGKSGESYISIAVEDLTSSTDIQVEEKILKNTVGTDADIGTKIQFANNYNTYHTITSDNRTNGMSIKVTVTGFLANVNDEVYYDMESSYTNKLFSIRGMAS